MGANDRNNTSRNVAYGLEEIPLLQEFPRDLGRGACFLGALQNGDGPYGDGPYGDRHYGDSEGHYGDGP